MRPTPDDARARLAEHSDPNHPIPFATSAARERIDRLGEQGITFHVSHGLADPGDTLTLRMVISARVPVGAELYCSVYARDLIESLMHDGEAAMLTVADAKLDELIESAERWSEQHD